MSSSDRRSAAGPSEAVLEAGLRALLEPTAADEAPCSEALYRYAAGDVTPTERRHFEAHLDSCESCQHDLASFEAGPALLAEALARAPRTTFAAVPFWRLWWSWGAVSAVLLAALVLALLPREEVPPMGGGRRPQPTLLIKGGERLHVAVKRGGQRFVAHSPARLRSGDVLSFFYTAGQPRWLEVLFIDEPGAVTTVYPASGRPKAPLPAGVKRLLPDGAVMEPGRGCEWIVAAFSAQRPSPGALKKALEGALKRRQQRGKIDDTCALPGLRVEGASVDTLRILRGP